MRYPEFKAAGLCTSTGVVEAGGKVAIGTRCKLSGRFEDSSERRSAARAAA